LAGDHDHQLPVDLLRLRDKYFSDGHDLVTLRMFDVMTSIERWFAAEHGFDRCAEMGSWVSDVERLGETGLIRPGHTYNHCSGFSKEMWNAIADSGPR
jgi:5-methylthioadenosine/S-adenosylhomocysteine deaminase